MSIPEGFTVREDLNLARTRERFIKPLLSDIQLQPMVELEMLCYPPPTNYDLQTLREFFSINGLLSLQVNPVEQAERLAAFHIVDTAYAELITLDVHPDFRRSGLGSWLVGRSMAILKMAGHRSVSCQIATTNDSSLILHERLCFVKQKKIKNYYGRGCDAFLLRAKL